MITIQVKILLITSVGLEKRINSYKNHAERYRHNNVKQFPTSSMS